MIVGKYSMYEVLEAEEGIIYIFIIVHEFN